MDPPLCQAPIVQRACVFEKHGTHPVRVNFDHVAAGPGVMRIAELKQMLPAQFTPDTIVNTLPIAIISVGITGAGVAGMDVVDGAFYAAKTGGIFLYQHIGACLVKNTQAECNDQDT
jgi:hypothetical protein